MSMRSRSNATSSSGPWYAVVMGQSGITLGLVLYEDLVAIKTLWVKESPDHETARRQRVGGHI